MHNNKFNTMIRYELKITYILNIIIYCLNAHLRLELVNTIRVFFNRIWIFISHCDNRIRAEFNNIFLISVSDLSCEKHQIVKYEKLDAIDSWKFSFDCFFLILLKYVILLNMVSNTWMLFVNNIFRLISLHKICI